MRLLTCSLCGRPFEKQHKDQARCTDCQPLVDDRSLAEYRRARAEVLHGSPICHWCKVNPATTADHLIPKAHGGTDEVWNLVPACGPCNYSRKDKSVPSTTLPRSQSSVSRQSRSMRLT
jgi:5-methylcytosine-specific restriction endonuclease McrA